MTNTQDLLRTSQLVNSIWEQKIEYILTRNVESPLNSSIKRSQYLKKDPLLYTILVIHFEIDFSEKFNLNVGFILIKVSNSDN